MVPPTTEHDHTGHCSYQLHLDHERGATAPTGGRDATCVTATLWCDVCQKEINR